MHCLSQTIPGSTQQETNEWSLLLRNLVASLLLVTISLSYFVLTVDLLITCKTQAEDL